MKRGLIISVLISLCALVAAQDRSLSLSFKKILFNDLVDTIEKTIPVRIYYSDKWVDSLYLNINAGNSNLDDILSGSLKREGFNFIITDENQVILSKGFSIKTNFNREYLEHLKKNYSNKDTVRYVRPVQEIEEKTISDEYRIFKVGKPSVSNDGEKNFLSGVVKNAVDGEPVAGAVIYVEKLKAGAMTNNAGYYSIPLPYGQYRIEYRMVGLRSTIRNIIIYSNGRLDVDMAESTSQLSEVIVSANRENIVRNVKAGIEKIDVKMLRQIPMGLGEADIIKSSLLLPGVQTVGEASGGYNVRGGSADQNLILLNNAPIINSAHFFGFFSAFNSDMIKDVTLYKNGIPAKFGGRISSVMDISLLEGNREELRISGGISPVTGRLLLEGPLKKGKVSFIIGARTTYSDWLLGMLKDEKLKNSTAGFYDIQGTLSGDINDKNSFSFSGYASNDQFDYFRENAFKYGNLAATLKWRHVYNTKLSAQYYAIICNYDYQLNSNRDSTAYNSLYYKLDQKILRADFTYFSSAKHRIEFGVDAVNYTLLPGVREPYGDYSVISYKRLEKERALEPSVYFSDEYELSTRLTLSAGIRGTLFTSFGPKEEFRYEENLPRTLTNITDTILYDKGNIVKIYPGLDFRFSSRYIISSGFSLKFGYQRVNQYIHMVSNTTSMSPTDVWKLSDSYIKPQQSDQFSIGLYNNYIRKNLETSLEVYYKNLSNILDYKGGAVLLMNEHLETDIIQGQGKAYGIEFMVRKQSGPLTGWISYTYSRVFLKVDSRFDEERVNGGAFFPANYDKPHDLKIVANTKLSRRFNFTGNFVYNTGRPITYPVAFYNFYNADHVYYSNRNEFRIPDYIRLDCSATLNGNLKARKLNHSSFTATVYNVLGRKNPYSIFFKNEEGEVRGYQMTIFAQPIFMLTYNFRIFGNAAGDF